MWLGEVHRSARQLELHYGIDDLAFTTTYWYGPEVDFYRLAERFGAAGLDWLCFHILAFEANKVLSLAPRTLDPGPHARWITPEFKTLWQTVGHKVWAQWRYQHQRPDYAGPLIEIGGQAPGPLALDPGPVEVLAFCGGGKDSLVALKLLEEAEIAYSSLAYAHSIYGLASPQHALIDGLLDHCRPALRHRQWVSDTFLDAPVTTLYPEYAVSHLLAAETPSSVFGVLPIVLTQGYRHIALAHERSADVGNLIWDATGEDVNHQWGKSLEAERLLNHYLQTQLIDGFSYFSLLKPLYDVVIFSQLRQYPAAVTATHSCNLAKPWCGKCPKCAYVWLNYRAYLPAELVEGMFPASLLEEPANALAFRQMIGLEAHTPFECIGQIPEARLAFELLRRQGIRGDAIQAYAELPAQDWQAVLAHYARVWNEDADLPPAIAERVLPLMQAAAARAHRDLTEALL